MEIQFEEITGLVLAGGRGSRMGGVDKGLSVLKGRPMIEHILERLRPQVGRIIINANRNADRYAKYHWPVVSDADPTAFSGPLAGMLAGLRVCESPWMLTAPCDSPWVPTAYAGTLLAAAHRAQTKVAMASDGRRHQPVFCLIHRDLTGSLQHFLSSGERKIDVWTRSEGAVVAEVQDKNAFMNINTATELRENDTL